MVNSRAKGARGERELAKKLIELGWLCDRDGQQGQGGGQDHPDVVGLPHIHIECKRVEKPAWSDEWLLQAKSDCGDSLPAVFHRRNNEQWKVTMDIADWVKLYDAFFEDVRRKCRA